MKPSPILGRHRGCAPLLHQREHRGLERFIGISAARFAAPSLADAVARDTCNEQDYDVSAGAETCRNPRGCGGDG